MTVANSLINFGITQVFMRTLLSVEQNFQTRLFMNMLRGFQGIKAINFFGSFSCVHFPLTSDEKTL